MDTLHSNLLVHHASKVLESDTVQCKRLLLQILIETYKQNVALVLKRESFHKNSLF